MFVKCLIGRIRYVLLIYKIRLKIDWKWMGGAKMPQHKVAHLMLPNKFRFPFRVSRLWPF